MRMSKKQDRSPHVLKKIYRTRNKLQGNHIESEAFNSQKINVKKIELSRWICGHTRANKIRN